MLNAKSPNLLKKVTATLALPVIINFCRKIECTLSRKIKSKRRTRLQKSSKIRRETNFYKVCQLCQVSPLQYYSLADSIFTTHKSKIHHKQLTHYPVNHVTHLKHRRYKVQPLQIQTLVLPMTQIMRTQHQWDPSTPKKNKTLRIQSKQQTGVNKKTVMFKCLCKCIECSPS